MRKFSLLFFIFILPGLCTLVSAQNEEKILAGTIFSNSVKTVRLYREEWNLSYPVISIGGNERLVLQFDLLGDISETFYYTFIHCDKDWNRSGIFTTDFIDGFPENPVEDYHPSFNTTIHYTNYRLAFPNERVNLKLSGNYIIMIFPSGEPENPVLTQRFIVSENLVGITVEAHRPGMTAYYNENQQIDFTVDYSGIKINDPYQDVFASILQNGRWNNAKRNIKPEFYGNNKLKYSALSDKNIFAGGNEFRYFDIRSIRYQSEYVKKIDFITSNYHVLLTPSENREFKPYFYSQDFNGKYYVAIQEENNPDTEADYVYVYFTLPSASKVEGGKMYVSGALSNWSYGPDNLMSYNIETRAYECILLLKQGWYNYEYFFQQDGDESGVTSKFEGNHYETENDYTVIIYYRNPRDRFDRVIGTQTVNTLNRIIY
ncbi:MAG TPA: DUF5103 domain-containing protein [Bacteroidales bacterium]|jgi:hypothetical protein|nr:DUF5103 domain-containing protein [Bacteroidales bacterium]HNR43112.1 DUF5103 domain-containing protein [Bacteroidales bacterium]HPM18866.1 DUF5103 domain-containing protein [Bacteroidales bacterium]HQG77932.1 DUF5103 domain-containing protein [Bacteroidales bacterium]